MTPRKTPIQNIAFMSMMAALNIIFSLLASFFPLAGLFIMIFLPLASALTAYYCQARYYPVYVVASLGLSIAVTAWDFSNTLFYLLPSLISGVAYGFFKKCGLPTSLTLFFVSLLNTGLTYLSLSLIELIYEIDMIGFLLGLLGLSENEYILYGVPAFIYAYSLSQSSLSNLFIEITPLHLDNEKPLPLWLSSFAHPLYALFCFAFVLLFSFFDQCLFLANLFALFGIYWTVFAIAGAIPMKKASHYWVLGGSFFIGLCISLPLLNIVPENRLYLLGIIALSGAMVGLFALNLLLLRKRDEPTINDTE